MRLGRVMRTMTTKRTMMTDNMTLDRVMMTMTIKRLMMTNNSP